MENVTEWLLRGALKSWGFVHGLLYLDLKLDKGDWICEVGCCDFQAGVAQSCTIFLLLIHTHCAGSDFDKSTKLNNT